MAEYAYFSEGILAKTDWNNLVEAIQLNLNYLEGFTGKSLTYIQGARNVIPRPIWSWNRVDAAGEIQAETLTARIDAVRAAVGFAPFEWPAGMVAGMAAGGRMLSATDARTLARAVGCPYTASQTQYPAAASVEPAYGAVTENITAVSKKLEPVARYEGGRNMGLDYYRVTKTDGATAISKTSKTAAENTQHILYTDEWGEVGAWPGDRPIEKLRSFAHSLMECNAWPCLVHRLIKWYDCGCMNAFFSAIMPDPSGIAGALTALGERLSNGSEIHFFTGSVNYLGLNYYNDWGFLPSKYGKAPQFTDPPDGQFYSEPFSPGLIGTQYCSYDFTADSHITDSAYSPQMAILSTPVIKQSKQWDIRINYWSYRFLADANVRTPSNYIVSKNEENANAVPPALYRARKMDLLGTITELGEFTAGAGAVSDFGGDTEMEIGCSIDPSWESMPQPNDANIAGPISYKQFVSQHTSEQCDNGEVMKRLVAYAEVDFTIPMVWLASRR